MFEKYHEIRRSRAKSRWAFGSLLASLALILGVVGCSLFGGSAREPSAGERPEVAVTEPQTEQLAVALAASVDAQGFVDYDAAAAQREPLNAYYNSIAYLDRAAYEAWDEASQIAFWCNAYNALTLLVVLENSPIESTLQGALFPDDSIRQIPGVWDNDSFMVMGEKISLGAIEHEILRKDFAEPRIHMAINCASVGCPPLRAEPFVAERLDEQLAEQCRRFVTNPDKFVVDRAEGTVSINPILDWFGEDFVPGYEPDFGYGDGGAKLRSVLHFAAGFLSSEDAKYLRDGDYDVDWLDYDWSLNRSR